MTNPGWSRHHPVPGVLVFRYDAWAGEDRPWMCRMGCASAPDPVDREAWEAWVRSQVASSARLGDGLVVSCRPSPDGSIVAILAIDADGGGSTLVQRWCPTSDPATGAATTLASIRARCGLAGPAPPRR